MSSHIVSPKVNREVKFRGFTDSGAWYCECPGQGEAYYPISRHSRLHHDKQGSCPHGQGPISPQGLLLSAHYNWLGSWFWVHPASSSSPLFPGQSQLIFLLWSLPERRRAAFPGPGCMVPHLRIAQEKLKPLVEAQCQIWKAAGYWAAVDLSGEMPLKLQAAAIPEPPPSVKVRGAIWICVEQEPIWSTSCKFQGNVICCGKLCCIKHWWLSSTPTSRPFTPSILKIVN